MTSKISSQCKTADYDKFYKNAQKFLKDRIYIDYLHRFAHSIDASCYRYIPRIVIKAHSESEIIALFSLSTRFNVPLCFRAAGTSLSGQACSDSVLVIATHKWQGINLIGETKGQDLKTIQSIILQCGVIGADANDALRKYGKKIGPDPATINSAMIGGIFSNNSSGMCCGVKQNSYHTIKSVRVILQDGSILDTSEDSNFTSFYENHKNLIDGLMQIRQDILKDENLRSMISRKFAIKNTTGYSINALLDFDTPRDILNHIFIGAEGTLGFVSQVEYFVVDDMKFKACALIFYKNLKEASLAVKILAKNDNIISAAEIMDYGCLKAVSKLENMPSILSRVQLDNCCILVQLESNEIDVLHKNIEFIKQELKQVDSIFGINFSFDSKEQESWWKIRKGILPISASTRPLSSTVITEDICFEIEYFESGMENLSVLFKKHGFEGIIFGHALSGNVHFIITPVLSDPAQKESFARFMDDMVEMVVSLRGSTKAEHGTGRMMAPFIQQEWGEKAYEINVKIKNLFDRGGLINPDVIICEDKDVHLKNLKPANAIEDFLGDFIDKCMECGFCEKVCPSKNLTLTPRQRIAVYREMYRLESDFENLSQPVELDELKDGFKYYGVDTCATCSMCAMGCPLEIDTANIANILNQNSKSMFTESVASFASNHIDSAVKVARGGVKLINRLGTRESCDESCVAKSDFIESSSVATRLHDLGCKKIESKDSKLSAITKKLNTIFRTPYVPPFMPSANLYKLESKFDFLEDSELMSVVLENKKEDSQNYVENNNIKNVIYFSSCLNRAFAPSKKMINHKSLQEIFENICKKAEINVIYPQKIESLCCGKAFKDYKNAKNNLATQTKEMLLECIKEHNLDFNTPIICDHSACSYALVESIKYVWDTNLTGKSLNIIDMPVFLESILNRLKITPINENIGIYPVCAIKKAKAESSLMNIAKTCTGAEIIEHTHTKCCGFAGNKGFLTPELNESALSDFGEFFRSLAENTKNKNAKGVKMGFSSSSTCEVGLSSTSGFSWQHIAYLLDLCSE